MPFQINNGNDLIANSGSFSYLTVSGTPVSLSGHTHTSSQVIDFNTSVSGLLPFTGILGSGYVVLNSSNKILTIGVSGLQPSGNYSIVGHTHAASDITNFNSSVSGLLPSVSGSGYVQSTFSNNIYLISVSGLQPSGNYSVSGHTHTASNITDFNSAVSGLLPFTGVLGSGNISITSFNRTLNISTTGLQPSGNYSVSGHTHIASDITNFNTSVSGLLPTVSGSGYAAVLLSNNIYTVSITGLQPSGNYSISGHNHTASNITDFNSATSGLLIPYALLNSGNFTNLFVTGTPVSLSGHKHLSSDITDFNSATSGLISLTGVTGSGYVVTSSNNKNITISITGLQPSGNYSIVGHTHTANNITDFNSATSGLLTPYAQLNDALFHNLSIDTRFVCNTSNFNVDEDGNTIINPSPLVNVSVPNLLVSYSLNFASGTASSGLSVFNYLTLNNTGVSLSGHKHIASDITNFNSSVSGLLPVKNIIAGTGIGISITSGIYTINSSGTGGGSSNVTISNSGSGRLLISDGTSSGIIGQSGLTFINSVLSVTGVPVSVSGHSHALTIGSGSGTAITYDSSQTLNILGSGNLSINYNDTTNTITLNTPYSASSRGYEVLGSGKSTFAVDGGYVVGNIDVYYNGIKLLNNNDYTATNGSSFTLSISGIVNDVVEWVYFNTSPRYQIIMGEVRSDFVSGVNYIGNAVQGSAEASGVWRIKKTSIDSNGSIISNLTATNVKWTDRLISTYV
jgi:hypothetical protein